MQTDDAQNGNGLIQMGRKNALYAQQARKLLFDLGLYRVGGAQDGACLKEAQRAERADIGLQQQIGRTVAELLLMIEWVITSTVA